MRILIFNWSVSGHRLEYLHHLYTLALERKDEDYVFIVPKTFNDIKDKFEWKDSENIKIEFINEKDQINCDCPQLLKSAWYKSLIVRKAVKKYNIDRVWLIFLMHFMPFLPFLLPNRVKISGIIYRLYFYEGTSIKGVRLCFEKLRYWLMVSCSNMDRLFVLNDRWATSELNRIYHTDKFKYLPDPIPEIDDSKVHDLRTEYNIGKEDQVFLHFGALDRRKGTIKILEAIQLLNEAELNDKVFIFAGKIKDDMREEFYSLTKRLNSKARILVFDQFCSYQHLYNLCYSCDCILIPYSNTNQSSGVIGYASYFGKPVIGPANGLLGRIIKEYELGMILNSLDAKSLAQSLNNFQRNTSKRYSQEHCSVNFVKAFSTTK